MIGVVGGVGAYAGLDLVRKIFDQTKIIQDHLPVAMLSVPHTIPDRTEFVLGHSQENPAMPIAKVIHKLSQMGATTITIPCNTAHVVSIFDEILTHILQQVELLHLIREVAHYTKTVYPSITKETHFYAILYCGRHFTRMNSP